MKIDIKFDDLSRAEKMELVKEVINSNDSEIKRLINSGEMLKRYNYDEECIIDMLQLIDDTKLANYIKNHYVPVPIIEKIAYGRGINVIREIINNPNYGDYFKIKYSKSDSEKIRVIVAENLGTPEILLEEMYKNDSNKVKCAIARNNKVKLLRKMVNSESVDVRKALAENENIPIEVMTILSKDKSYAVRSALIKNPKTPLDIVKDIYSSRRYKNKDCTDVKKVLQERLRK